MVEQFEEYFENRFVEQREWYSEKSSWNKKWYLRLRVAVVALAGVIPLSVSVIGPTSPVTVPLLYTLALLLIVTEAMLSAYNFQENWINYRTVSEALKKERELFKTRTGPYAAESNRDPQALFIKRVEELISQENRVWRITTEREEGDTPGRDMTP